MPGLPGLFDFYPDVRTGVTQKNDKIFTIIFGIVFLQQIIETQFDNSFSLNCFS